MEVPRRQRATRQGLYLSTDRILATFPVRAEFTPLLPLHPVLEFDRFDHIWVPGTGWGHIVMGSFQTGFHRAFKGSLEARRLGSGCRDRALTWGHSERQQRRWGQAKLLQQARTRPGRCRALGSSAGPVVQGSRRPFIRSFRRPFESSLARDNAVAEGSSIQERTYVRGFSPRRDNRTIGPVIMRIKPVGQIATIIPDSYPTVGPRGIQPARIFWVWENRGPAPGTIFPRSDGTGSDIGTMPDLHRTVGRDAQGVRLP